MVSTVSGGLSRLDRSQAPAKSPRAGLEGQTRANAREQSFPGGRDVHQFPQVQDPRSRHRRLLSLPSFGAGAIGIAAKKFLVSADDSFSKKFLIGVGVAVLTAGTGLVPFLLAGAGQQTKADLNAAKQEAATNRYGG